VSLGTCGSFESIDGLDVHGRLRWVRRQNGFASMKATASISSRIGDAFDARIQGSLGFVWYVGASSSKWSSRLAATSSAINFATYALKEFPKPLASATSLASRINSGVMESETLVCVLGMR